MPNAIEGEDPYLSEHDKQLLRDYIADNYYNKPDDKKDYVIDKLGDIKFDEKYRSSFTTQPFTDSDKKYNQALDKIQAYFKYGDPIIEETDASGGKKSSKKKKTYRRRTNKRRRNNKRRTNRRRY
jgi:hypothetical protein